MIWGFPCIHGSVDACIRKVHERDVLQTAAYNFAKFTISCTWDRDEHVGFWGQKVKFTMMPSMVRRTEGCVLILHAKFCLVCDCMNANRRRVSDECYVQFYGYMSQQQNMMQDYIRTSTYQRAMLDNSADFQDKVRSVWLNCSSSQRRWLLNTCCIIITETHFSVTLELGMLNEYRLTE